MTMKNACMKVAEWLWEHLPEESLTLLLIVVVLLLLNGCTKTLALREYDPVTGRLVREGEYRNTGFDTKMNEMSLTRGDTRLEVKRYDSETQAYEALGKGFEMGAAAFKAGRP
jgi:hypothetical protein